MSIFYQNGSKTEGGGGGLGVCISLVGENPRSLIDLKKLFFFQCSITHSARKIINYLQAQKVRCQGGKKNRKNKISVRHHGDAGQLKAHLKLLEILQHYRIEGFKRGL